MALKVGDRHAVMRCSHTLLVRYGPLGSPALPQPQLQSCDQPAAHRALHRHSKPPTEFLLHEMALASREFAACPDTTRLCHTQLTP